MNIAYLNGARLRRALIAGCENARRQRAELNRINVFPVPDGDTGTNLALTVHAIADRLRESRESSAGGVARQAAEAGILGARGNVGMILSQFLLGFARAVGDRARLSVTEFSAAFREAVTHLYDSLERPVEGTIVTIIRETAEEAAANAQASFDVLVERLVERAKASLERTPELLPALRNAGVVDAGAKGFVHFLEGIAAFVHGDPLVSLPEQPDATGVEPAVARVEYPDEAERFRFCTEALVRGADLPSAEEVRGALRDRGDSLVVVRGDDVLKVHIHTDDPEAIFATLRGWGTLVAHKAEDMQVQHEAVGRAAAAHVQLARRPIAIVTDSSCDLPEEVIRAHGIHVVPLSLIFGDTVLRDGVDIDAEAFVERLRNGERATTSQPPPAAFFDAYAAAAQDGESVLSIILASALSGTFASAETAAKQFEDAPVRMVDSRAASLALGLLVLRAAELAELGKQPGEIAAELDRVRAQSGLLFTVDTLDNLLASGRIGRGTAWLGGLLDIKPILGLEPDGTVTSYARVRGRENVLPRVMQFLEERVDPDAERLRFGIIHVGCPEIVEPVAEAIRARYGDREIISAAATPVLATHIGPGAWGIAYQRED